MRAEEERKKKPTKRKILLTTAEHQLVMSHLPRNYSLVQGKEWITYLVKQQADADKEKTKMLVEEHQRSEMKAEASENPLPAIESQFTSVEASKAEPSPHKQRPQAMKMELQQQKTNTNQQIRSEEQECQQPKLILHLLSKIVNHAEFTVIFHSKMRPTAQQQIDAIKKKIAGNYNLINFEFDIDQIFASFFKQVGHNQRTSLFRDLAKSNISKYLKRSQINQQKIAIKRLEQVQAKNEQLKKRQEEESDQAHCSSSREQSDENIKTRLRGEALITRSHESYISLNEMAALGFNIRKLSSEHLKWICLNFINGSKEKAGMRNSNFTLDIEALPTDQFWKLESFVKKKLSFAGIPYDRPPAEEDDGFVIEDDDEDIDDN